MSGLRELPVILHRFTALEQLEIMLVENLQRRDLSPLQEGRGFQALVREGLSRSEIMRRLSIPSRRVQQGLALLTLDPVVARSFDSGDLPQQLITEFAHLPNPAEQRRYATLALQRRLKTGDLIEYMRQQRRAEAHVSVAARPGARPSDGADAAPATVSETSTSAVSAETDTGGHAAAATGECMPAARAVRVERPEAHTRSEAVALLTGDATASFAVLRRAMKHACQGCDEEHYPTICRACPMPQFIASIVAECVVPTASPTLKDRRKTPIYRSWWTRERVLAGLRRLYADTGRAPNCGDATYRRLLREYGQHGLKGGRRHYPTIEAVLCHWPSFAASWKEAGITPDGRRGLTTSSEGSEAGCAWRREVGERHGRLVIVEFAAYYRWGQDGKHRTARWRCRCDCGREEIVRAGAFKRKRECKHCAWARGRARRKAEAPQRATAAVASQEQASAPVPTASPAGATGAPRATSPEWPAEWGGQETMPALLQSAPWESV
ncbi:MAG: ParB family transcriptional regulator, chromosome partitioning protein [Pyrinomonadaceae bacterium]|nr:ParB family transcriptional regulator, chromosome partitioning protein [Pyrinomonadaceae bacterium]